MEQRSSAQHYFSKISSRRLDNVSLKEFDRMICVLKSQSLGVRVLKNALQLREAVVSKTPERVIELRDKLVEKLRLKKKTGSVQRGGGSKPKAGGPGLNDRLW